MNFRHVYAFRLLYGFMIGLLLYLLLVSRSGETHTVWDTMHPAFIPAFFATTILLLIAVFSSSERVKFKLLFVIAYSIVAHSFYNIVFLAGYTGGQQAILGTTRLIFDSTIHDGYTPWPPSNVLVLLYDWLRGNNFQGALSVVFARMFSVDVFWTHLWLIPMLWGIFVPIMIFKITRTIGGDETTSVLASLLTTTFPYTILWGTQSIPNSLGYIFFLSSLLFLLRFLSSQKFRVWLLIATFFLASVLSHPLTGIIALSFLLLAISLKSYESEKKEAPLAAKFSLTLAFLLSTVILPFSLLLQRFIYPQYTSFGLSRLEGLTTAEILSLFILGELVNFEIVTMLIFALGPLLGFIGIMYVLYRRKKRTTNEPIGLNLLLISLGFAMVLANYRILKLFMVALPFDAERIWIFRDFLMAPFAAILVNRILTFLRGKTPKRTSKKKQSSTISTHFTGRQTRTVIAHAVIILLLAAWLTASIYHAYPHTGYLQTTYYELEAVEFIETTAQTQNKSYIVICDPWMSWAGGMLVGVNNSRAFYFPSLSRKGTELFINMTENPSVNNMLKAMETNNATTAYFIVEEPRLPTEEFNDIVDQAKENFKYHTFGDGKLYIFYYEEQTQP